MWVTDRRVHKCLVPVPYLSAAPFLSVALFLSVSDLKMPSPWPVLPPLWYFVIHCDILWSTVIFYNLLWYPMIYYDILWSNVISCDLLWYLMIHSTILWSTVIYCLSLSLSDNRVLGTLSPNKFFLPFSSWQVFDHSDEKHVCRQCLCQLLWLMDSVPQDTPFLPSLADRSFLYMCYMATWTWFKYWTGGGC